MATVRAASVTLGVLCGEVRKTRSLPVIARCLILGLLAVSSISAFGVFQTIQFTQRGRVDDVGGLGLADWPLLALHFGQLIPILLGAWVFGQDIGTGPGRTALLAVPSRRLLVLAKFVVVVALTVLAGVICSLGALVPLLATGGQSAEGVTIDMSRVAWLIGYWVSVALISASIAAATRSMALAVVPLVVWAVGISDLLTGMLPFLSGAADQVFKAAYQAGNVPSVGEWVGVVAQVGFAVVFAVVVFLRRDSN